MNKALDQFLALWTKLSFNQRIILGTLSFAAVLVIFFFFTQSQEDYDVMLSNLDEGDAAAVVQNLKASGVPYRLSEGGTTILVPRSKKEELRLGVFQDDLIKSDKAVGFGALSTLPFGLTDWQEQKYDQKIISDEVVTTLERIQGIKKARVILAQGEDSLFSDEKVEPTASVMLIVDPGLRLKPDQVKTIKALVSHAVPGMKADNVAISDSMGNSLSDELGVAHGTGSGSESDDARTMYEKQKAKDILEMLTAVVGPNNAVVKVSAVINFDRAESKIKRFLPAGGTAENPTGIPVSVQRNIEAYTGNKDKDAAAGMSKSTQGGAPGTASNIPVYTAEENNANKGSKDASYQNEQLTTNYEISSEEKTIVHATGAVEKMTVAVVVNKVLTESETKEISNLVASASGADFSRGDTITISGLQFSPDLKNQQQESLDILKQSNQQTLIITLAQYAGVFILALVALFIFYKLIQRPAEGELMDEGDDDEHEHFATLSSGPEPSLLGTSSIPALEAKLDPEIEEMRESINAMVHKDPAEAARVLVTFMKDM